MLIIDASPPTLWTPARLSAGSLSLWFDASDLSTITLLNGNASEWRNKQSLISLSQSTAAQQPALTLGAQNGLSVLTFDGINDFMFNPSVGASGSDVVQILTVLRMITGGSSQDILMGVGQIGATNSIRTLYRAVGGTSVAFAGWSNDVNSSTHSWDIGGGFHIFEVWNTQRATPNQIRIGRNGTITTHSVNNMNKTVDGFSVGSLQGSTPTNLSSNIAVGEILVSFLELSNINRQLAEGYLAWKWGLQAKLPTAHPFRNRVPLVSDA